MAEDFNKTMRHGKVTISFSGFNELFNKLDHLGVDIIETAKGVFNDAGPRLLAASQNLVPVDEGDLKASGRFSKARVSKKDVVTASVNYGGAPLDRLTGKAQDLRAVMVHERLELKHTSGSAKYLERPFLAAKESVMEALRAKIAAMVERGK